MSFDINDNTYFRLFFDCIPVKGYTRSIICDVSRHHFDFIPNSLYFILTKYASKSLETIFKDFDKEDHATLIEYLEYLFDKEYIFWCTKEELESFPNEQLKFETPAFIDNCIVDVDERSDHNWKKIIVQLDELGCTNMQIRIFEKYDFEYCAAVFDLLEKSTIKYVEILLPYCNEAGNKKFLLDFSKKYPRLGSLILHSAPYEKNITIADTSTNITITSQVINSSKCCGVINPVFFTVNIDFFAESLKHNTCLNKKISVDAFGYIKNCPSMKENYGHIDTTSLKVVLGNSSFTSKWKIKKDDIKICMDCEFRYVCTDCRAFKEQPGDEFSKPLKCGYDPYTGEWQKNKSNLPEFMNAAAFYELKDIVF